MLRPSLFNDPFFYSANDHMSQMDRMFDDSFGQTGRRNRAALSQGHHHHQHSNQIAQHGMFMNPFSQFESMFSNMHSMMTDMRRTFAHGPQPGNDGQVYQHSSFMSYSSTGNGNGPPQVYQASSSSRQGPNGLRETRQTVRDSEAGIDKMAVGHHIRDRGHVVERSRNNHTGDMNENQEYINLDEEEAESFDQEFRDKLQSTMRGVDQRRHAERLRHAPIGGGHRRHHVPAALPEPEARRPRKTSNRRE